MKNSLWMGILGVCLMVSGASAQAAPKKEIYTFENGNRVVTVLDTVPSVYFENKLTKERVLIGSGDDASFPSEKTNGRGRTISPGALTVDVSFNNRTFWIHQSGRIEQVPLQESKLLRTITIPRGASVPIHKRVGNGLIFEFEGEKYLVASYAYAKDEPKEGDNEQDTSLPTGETYIVRGSDLEYVRVGYQLVEVEPTIHDGILTFKECPRKIDLRAFDAEVRFQARLAKKVEDPDGDEVDVVQDLESRYQNLIDEAASRNYSFEPLDPQALRRLRNVFQREESGSAVLLGDSGTGKSQLVYSLAQGIARGDYPEFPRTLKLIRFDPITLAGGAKYTGVFEARVKSVIEACKYFPCLLFIDEFHSMRGSGTHSGNGNDAFQYLKPSIAEGDIRILGTDTPEEFNHAIAGDPALRRRVIPVTVEEPTQEKALQAARSWIGRFKKPAPSDAVLAYAAQLAAEFSAIGANPAKTIDLLEETYAEMVIEGRKDEAPTRADLEQAAQRLYSADPAFFDLEKMKEKIDKLEVALNSRIIGLTEYKEALIEQTRQRVARVHDPSKPPIRILVAGPRGTGKTECAKVYAEELGLPFIRIEMNQFDGHHPKSSAKHFLKVIADALRKNAFSVLVFDEIEKASFEVQNAALGLLDSGIFSVDENIDTRGEASRTVRVSALNASVVATTNAGSEFILAKASRGGNGPMGFSTQTVEREKMSLMDLRKNIVEDGISPPVLDRFPAVVPAYPPTAEGFAQVLELHLDLSLMNMGKRLGLTVVAKNRNTWLTEMSAALYYPGISNRDAHVAIADTIGRVVAKAVLAGETNRAKKKFSIVLPKELSSWNSACERIVDPR